MHEQWRLPIPSPADILRNKRMPEAVQPLAGALTTPPLHTDTIARAVCEAVENPDVRGIEDVEAIQRLAGWLAPEART